MRKVPGDFSAGIAKAESSRNAPGGKNCQVNRLLSQYAGRPWDGAGDGERARVAVPKEAQAHFEEEQHRNANRRGDPERP
jgi:hypothetical protein